jgi:uncharacterized protein (TIGR00251 family)
MDKAELAEMPALGIPRTGDNSRCTMTSVQLPTVQPAPEDANSSLLWIKAVPGASCEQIVGTLGQRLKIRVAAVAEGGQANRAVCTMLAKALAIKSNHVAVVAGQGHPQKTVLIQGIPCVELRARLESMLQQLP